ncbi:hypothetical protein HYU17_02225 [Candidatus Woesearchaeota archaeon]|nr:hypothetical protein [Candidatus Woesearchaeota archaeon]
MDWKDCEEGFIRKVDIDREKAESIIETAEARLGFIRGIQADKKNASFIVEGYYEAIKELLVAMLLSKGLRSKNHQCLISYFYQNHPEYEAEAHLIAQMSCLRNQLDYYGESIDFAFYDKNKGEFDKVVELLKKLIQNKEK